MIVEKILGSVKAFENEHVKIDWIRVEHHAMEKPHQKLKTEAGKMVAVSLPRGEHLFDGAVLYKDSETIIALGLKPEDVLEIHPEGALQWAKAAYNIGNMHHPAYLLEEGILSPYDGMVEKMLQQMGVPYERRTRTLDGQRANYVTGSHSHSHSHVHHPLEQE